MKQYDVKGMSCAACSSRVEKAVSKLDGVNSCSVSLLTNSMSVEGTATSEQIIEAVEKAGYFASPKGKDTKSVQKHNEVKDTETPQILRRLIASLIFLIPLMYVSMGHMMWEFPLPQFLSGNPLAIGLLQFILTAIVMVINQKFFINGFKGLLNKAPNMDTLVALGSGTAFVYSTYSLFAMTQAQLVGDMVLVHSYMHELYFESSAMILTLITVGKMLEARSKGKTTNALKSLMDLSPKTATLLVDGIETEVLIEEVKKGDVFVVRPGENIPVDGVIIDGVTAVDESALTGESIPVDKTKGDTVKSATINSSGFIKCEAIRVGEDTTLSQIIKMVSDASATKAPIAKIADKVSGIFVPAVISISIITAIIWLFVGESIGFALARAISVLVISCPCALGLATPVAIMVGSGVGAKNGILYKTAVSLESSGRINIVALDKTGTITKGEPVVTDIITNQLSEKELLQKAYSLESKSEHPLAKAINERAKSDNVNLIETENFKIYAGNGLYGEVEGKKLYGGNYKFISGKVIVPNQVKNTAEKLAEAGKTPLFFAEEEKLIGVIAVADVIKEESPKAIKELKNMGIRVVMLTGDNQKTAQAIGNQAGVDEVVAGVLPDGKEAVINELKKHGKVAMVGDGINDAPALTSADLGIAIGAGSDIAIESADVVLMKSKLSDVPATIRLGRATLRNIHENLFWAFIYNVIGIPLAAGVFISLLGWQMNPMFGAAAMSLSSFCVVSNSLRLNFIKVHSTKRDRKIKNKTKEKKQMEITLKIEGMMCPHCEARVKKVLEELDGVSQVLPSHENGTAVITLEKEVDFAILKSTVENQGYTVIE